MNNKIIRQETAEYLIDSILKDLPDDNIYTLELNKTIKKITNSNEISKDFKIDKIYFDGFTLLDDSLINDISENLSKLNKDITEYYYGEILFENGCVKEVLETLNKNLETNLTNLLSISVNTITKTVSLCLPNSYIYNFENTLESIKNEISNERRTLFNFRWELQKNSSIFGRKKRKKLIDKISIEMDNLMELIELVTDAVFKVRVSKNNRNYNMNKISEELGYNLVIGGITEDEENN